MTWNVLKRGAAERWKRSFGTIALVINYLLLHRNKEEGNIRYIIKRRRQTGQVAPSVETDV